MAYRIKRTADKFQTTEAPGLIVTLRRWSDRERMAMQDEIADLNQSSVAILDELQPLQDRWNESDKFARDWYKEHGENVEPDWEQFAGKRLAGSERVHFLNLSNKITIVNAEIRDQWMTKGIVSIEGFEIEEGQETRQGTIDEFVEFADDPVIAAVYNRVRVLAGLFGDEEKNSESPTISVEPAAGETKGSIA